MHRTLITSFIVSPLLTMHTLASGADTSVRFVDASAARSGDGTAWATAYRTLQEALTDAASDSSITQIWIADGTYTPAPPGGAQTKSFVLVSGVALYGGFAGGESTLGERDPIANVCVLSGDLNGDDGPSFAHVSDNVQNVLTATNLAQTATLDGLQVRGGYADYNPDALLGGGGLLITSSPVNLTGCVFTGNAAGINQPSIGGFGGAIHDYGGALVATDCVFVGNRGDNGGAIGMRDFNDGTVSATFVDCQFIGNSAIHQTGGAIWTGVNPFDTVERSLTLVGCLFEDNEAQYAGAIIDQNTKHTTLVDCVFRGNSAVLAAGAIWHNQSAGVDQEPMHVLRCTFEDNQSGDEGGAVFFTAADSIFASCTFSGNSSSEGFGGAIHSGVQFGASFGAGDLEIDNCVFTGNTAQVAGAVSAVRNPVASITNCTFAANSATQGPGGLFGQTFGLIISNSIFWMNQNGAETNEAAQLVHSNSFGPLTLNHTCVQGLTGALSGIGNIGDDPSFLDLDGDDGIVGTGDDDVHVAADAPVVDAGDVGALPPDAVDVDADGDVIEPLPLDRDGGPRVVGRAPDMGAFEIVVPGPLGDLNGDGSVGAADLALLLGAWGACEACPADLDGDGAVGAADLALLLGAWS